jgi:hypothetical protein
VTAAARLAAVFPLTILASSIASTSEGAGGAIDIYPTKFDYLVLASIADSQQPFAMARYSQAAAR